MTLTKFTEITLHYLPEIITVNQNTFGLEIAWGVAIDIDNNSSTGGKLLFGNRFLNGYELALVAHHFKKGQEYSDTLQRIFGSKVDVLELQVELQGGTFYYVAKGSIKVDLNNKTITLRASNRGITPSSHLHFYTHYEGSSRFTDELCSR